MTTAIMKNPWGIGARRPRRGSWAGDLDECRRCRRDDRPHKAHGLCKICYQVEWFKLKRSRDFKRK